ncbi:MAG: SMC-Scp complex subunit ScpB [Pseudomonadota bacterium]
MRIVEALLFASPTAMKEPQLAQYLPDGTDVAALLADLQASYAGRGVVLARVSGGWMFRTSSDLAYLHEQHTREERRLSKAAMETLAIIAYHQPCTRAEIEEVRGVGTSKGTLDALMDIGWVRPRGRRRAPGRPVTYGTTDAFLAHFSLDSVRDLPGLTELKGAGLLGADLPPDFEMPSPTEVAALMPDELPLEEPAAAEQAALDLPMADGEDTTHASDDLDDRDPPEAEQEDRD